MRTNCFVTRYQPAAGPEMVLLACQGNQVSGLEFDGKRFAVPKTLAVSQLDTARLTVTHYYGLDWVEYRGVWDAARGLIFGIPYAYVHARRLKNSALQRLFNRKTLRVPGRIDILQAVVNAVSRGASSVDSLDLMSVWHGDRWADHPHWEQHQREIDVLLDLLAQAGELACDGGSYRPTGQGLKTLEERGNDDRNRRRDRTVQVSLALIALVAALFTGVQAGFVKVPTLADWSKPSQASETSSPQAAQAPSPVASTANVATRAASAASAPPSASRPSSGPSASSPSTHGNRTRHRATDRGAIGSNSSTH